MQDMKGRMQEMTFLFAGHHGTGARCAPHGHWREVGGVHGCQVRISCKFKSNFALAMASCLLVILMAMKNLKEK